MTTGVAVFCVTATVAIAELQTPLLTVRLYVPDLVTVGVADVAPDTIPPAGPAQEYPPPPDPDKETVVVKQVNCVGGAPAFAVGVVVTVTTTDAQGVLTLQFTFAA